MSFAQQFLSEAKQIIDGAFDALVQQSIKGCGTPHPAVLSLEAAAGTGAAVLSKEGETDWVLKWKAGGVELGIILVGKVEG